jgi:hypothetical protein
MVLFIVILRTTPRLQILSFSLQFPAGFHDSLALFFLNVKARFFCLNPKEIVGASHCQLWKDIKELITGK